MNALLFTALFLAGPIFHFRTGGRDDLTQLARTGTELDARGEIRLVRGATSGTVQTPELVPDAPFVEAVVSWEGSAPVGTWIEVRASALVGDRWTSWYVLGVWSESSMRHSVTEQKDADGDVETDTLILRAPARALRIEASLASARSGATPLLRGLHAVVTERERHATPLWPDARVWGTEIAVPARSQMQWPGGGEVWCSPTSTSMVLDYFGVRDPVPQAAASTYDWIYEGTGNWPFNTAYAAARGGAGIEAFVTRLYQIEQLERLVAAGIPVVAGVRFREGELPGAPVAWTDGHLLVVRGFDVAGNVLVNDPAASTDDLVRLIYDRQAFDRAWSGSRRTIYVVHSAFVPLPEAGSLGCW